MKSLKLGLFALILALPFAAKANAQVAIGIGVGPAVVETPVDYGPPVCDWGYYPYYPYACAPYGYYGPTWFANGIFIGAGPWYGWGWRHGWYGHGWYGRGWEHGWRGGYAYRGGHGYRGGYGHGGYGN